MADGAIALEIVTPDGVALSESVDALTAPSVQGEFGVLPGHRPLLAALKTGIMSYHQGHTEVRLAVGPGFVEVVGDKAVLLTDQVAHKEDIDPVRVRLDLKEVDEALDRFTGKHGSPEHVELIRRELWAAAQLTLYGDPPPPTVHTLHESLAGGETFIEDEEPGEAEASPAEHAD
jgi:F-type H+-transporting ATPase subunit epsilon